MKIVLIILGIWLAFTVVAVGYALSKVKKINNYKELYKDMPIEEAIKLMGKDYKKEELPKYDKYTWEITSSKYQGINTVIVQTVKGVITNIQTLRK